MYIFSGYKKRKATKKGLRKPSDVEKEFPPFMKGIMLSMINPLAIPYWLAVSTSLKAAGQLSYDWKHTHFFICGIVIGTFAALTMYGSLGEVLESKLKRVEKHFNTIIGLVLISLAIFQIYRVFVK